MARKETWIYYQFIKSAHRGTHFQFIISVLIIVDSERPFSKNLLNMIGDTPTQKVIVS